MRLCSKRRQSLIAGSRSMGRVRYAVTLSVLLLVGCGRLPAPMAGGAQTVNVKTPLPGGVRGRGWHIPWREADPTHPKGPQRTVFVADAEEGEMTDPGDHLTLHLNGVRARLFRAGRPAADLIAQHVVTDRQSRIVHASGSVKIVSLANPPDTQITADRMTWDTRTSQVKAEGNARALHTYRDGRPPDDTLAPRIDFDTATGRIAFHE